MKKKTVEFKASVNLDRCYDWLSSIDREKKDKYTITSDIVLPKALDGGWGWIVVFGSFIINFICFGIIASVGVIYTELLIRYNESKSKTSFLGSVLFGVSMLLGPLASILTSHYGCRVVTILGGLVSSLGMFLSVFATSINILCITFSFIVGAAFCLCFVTSVAIVSFYFDTKISLATGIAVCGSGLGTVTFAPFMEYLIEEFKLGGMFLILSGICMNLVVCGMLFRPLQFTKMEKINKMLNKFNKIPRDVTDIEMPENTFGVSSVDIENDDCISLVCVPTFVPEYIKTKKSMNLINALYWGRNPDLTVQRYMTNSLSVNMFHKINGSSVKSRMTLSDDNDTIITEQPRILTFDSPKDRPDIVLAMKRGSIFIAQGEKIRTSLRTTRLSLRKDSAIIHNPAPRRSFHSSGPTEMNRRASPKRLHSDSQRSSEVANTDRTYRDRGRSRSSEVANKDRTNRPRGRSLPGHTIFVTNLPLYRSDIFFRRLIDDSCVVGTSCPQLYVNDIYGREKISLLRRISSGLVKGLRSLMDFSIFSSFFFCTFVLSNCIYYLWSSVPLLFGTHHAINIGATRQDAALLLSYLGISNTVGLIFFGVIGDMDVNLLHIYSGAFVLAGFFVAVIPLTDFSTMIGCYVLFGFFVAVNYPLTTVILVQYVGLNKLTDAFGLLFLFQGIASFIGPVIAGYTADVSGDYNLSFYCSGSFFMMSGLIVYATYLTEYCTDIPDDLTDIDFE